MKFSIIMPTFNYAQYLPKAIDAVLAQSNQDFELIIIDDGSTDNTQIVLESYAKQHPTKIKIILQKNLGASAARNAGIKISTGKYIYCIDSDDTLLIDAIDIMNEATSQYPNADMIVATSYSIDKNGKKKLTKIAPITDNNIKNFINYLRKKFSLPHGSHCIKREVFDTLQYPNAIFGKEDQILFAHILASHSIATTDKPTTCILKHADSYRHLQDLHRGKDQIVDTLFDPSKIPAQFLKYKKEFASRLYLSWARHHFLSKQFKLARHCYYQALYMHIPTALKWRPLKRFARCIKKTPE